MEELRQKNLPSSTQTVEQQTQVQPIVIQCALPEVAEQLNQSMEALEWYAKRQTELLQEIRNTQIERTAESLKRIEQQLSQAGKEKEKPSLLSRIRLPSFHLISWSSEMVTIPLLLLALFMGWYSLDKLWNGISQLVLK